MKKGVLDIQIAGESNLGLCRSRNEDSFVVCRADNGFGFACVADGIGSHSDGQMASSVCCRDFLNAALCYDPENNDPETFLVNGCRTVNEKIFERNFREARPRPMGCTAVAAIFSETHINIANVGDSRFYEFVPGRSEPLRQITVDHHPDDELLEKLSGKYNMSIETLRARVLLYSIGIRHRVEPDLFRLERTPGAIYMLCSDGLSGLVAEERIAGIISRYQDNMRELTSNLVREALIAGGKDNVTVISAKYNGG